MILYDWKGNSPFFLGKLPNFVCQVFTSTYCTYGGVYPLITCITSHVFYLTYHSYICTCMYHTYISSGIWWTFQICSIRAPSPPRPARPARLPFPPLSRHGNGVTVERVLFPLLNEEGEKDTKEKKKISPSSTTNPQGTWLENVMYHSRFCTLETMG